MGRHGVKPFLAQGTEEAPPRRVRAQVIPITPSHSPTWTVSSIRGALNQHEQGFFNVSAPMWDAMGRDDRIPPVLRHRTRGMLGMPFDLPTADDTVEAQDLADRWLKLWPRFAPTAILGRLLDDYIMLGVALAQIHWVQVDGVDGKVWEPRLTNMDAEFLRYDETLRQWFYNTRVEGEIEIIPGDGKWVLLESGERGYRNGAIRALALMWHIRNMSWMDWARYTERHGTPLLKAMVPAEVQDSSREEFWDDIVNLGRESAVLLPQGVGSNKDNFDVQIIEARDGSWRAFQELKKDATIAVAVYLLGQNLTTEIQAGSYAAATVHKNIRNEVLQADETELGNDLLEQAVRPISEMLVAGGRLIAPRPTWNTKPPADQEQDAQVINTAASGAKTLIDSGFALDQVEYAKQFGIPLIEGATNELKPTPPPTPPTPPVPPPSDGDEGDKGDEGDEGDEGNMSAKVARRILAASGIDDPQILDGLPPPVRAEFVEHLLLAQSRAESQGFNKGMSDNAAFDAGRDLNVRLLRPILKVIEDAEDFGEVRRRVLELFAESDASVAQEVLEQLLRLGELNALHDVDQEIGEA